MRGKRSFHIGEMLLELFFTYLNVNRESKPTVPVHCYGICGTSVLLKNSHTADMLHSNLH